MKVIEFSINQPMLEALDSYADDHECSRAAAIRYAIKRLLVQHKYPVGAKTPPTQ